MLARYQRVHILFSQHVGIAVIRLVAYSDISVQHKCLGLDVFEAVANFQFVLLCHRALLHGLQRRTRQKEFLLFGHVSLVTGGGKVYAEFFFNVFIGRLVIDVGSHTVGRQQRLWH